MKRIVYLTLLLLISSCALDSRQEEKLNEAFHTYIDSHNKGLTLQYVALTHVNVVKHYKSKGNDAFLAYFNKDKDSIYYGEYFVKDTKTEGKHIQRCFTVERYNQEKELNHAYRIFACSEDEGKSWFFINEDDYFNDSIPLAKRLFKH